MMRMDVERLSDADLKLLQRRHRLKEQVAFADQFISAHFAEVYGLQPGDVVQDDGAITRATSEPRQEPA